MISRKRRRHAIRQYLRQPVETRWIGSAKFVRRNPTKVCIALDMLKAMRLKADEMGINGTGNL
jgi:hypothetical protein